MPSKTNKNYHVRMADLRFLNWLGSRHDHAHNHPAPLLKATNFHRAEATEKEEAKELKIMEQLEMSLMKR